MTKPEDFRPEKLKPESGGPKPGKSPQRDDSNFGKFATVGLEIAVGAGLGALIGTWCDRHWHIDPWGVLIGTFLGIASGMYLLFKEAARANKD
jgi:F0F1-type ATP synthase assembly protein I